MALLARFNAGSTPTSSANPAPAPLGVDDGMLRGCGGDAEFGPGPNAASSSSSSSSSSSTTPSPLCRRCRLAQSTCKLRDGPHCETCAASFLSGRLHRSLGAPPGCGRDVLLAVSGSASTMSALHMVADNLDAGKTRRWWTDTAAVYVDTSAITAFQRDGGDSGSRTEAAAGGGVAAGASFSSPSTTTTSTSTTSTSTTSTYTSSHCRTVVRSCMMRGLNTYVVPIESFFAGRLCVAHVAAPERVHPSRDEAVVGAEAAATTTTAAQGDASSKASSSDTRKSKSKKNEAGKGTPTLPPVDPEDAEARVNGLCAVLDAARGRAAGGSGGMLEEAAARLNAALMSCPSADRRQEAVDILTKTLLWRMTSALKYSVLMTFETADEMALKAFCSTFSGEGFSVPLDVAAIDLRFAAEGPAESTIISSAGSPISLALAEDSLASTSTPLARLPFNWYPSPIKHSVQTGVDPILCSPTLLAPGGFAICRPIADLEADEISLYARIFQLQTEKKLTFLSSSAPRTSVTKVAEGVLTGLQASFPSTVHNVVRTLRKLMVPAFPPSSSAAASSRGPLREIDDEEGEEEEEADEEAAEHDDGELDNASVEEDGDPRMSSSGFCSFCCNLLPRHATADVSNAGEAGAGVGVQGQSVGGDEGESERKKKTAMLCYRCKRLRSAAPGLFI